MLWSSWKIGSAPSSVAARVGPSSVAARVGSSSVAAQVGSVSVAAQADEHPVVCLHPGWEAVGPAKEDVVESWAR